MKRIKKLASIVLAMVMVLAMAIPTMAAETTGSITINGSEGNGQEGTGVSVAGKTFTAYQVLTAELVNGTSDAEGIVYRVPEALKPFYANYFDLELTSNGDYEDEKLVAPASFDQDVTEAIAAMKDKAEELQAFAKEVLAAAKAANITGETVTAGENATSVKIENLPLGYYVIEDVGTATPISALALDTTATDATVNVKASQPVIEKKIDGDNDTDDNTEGLVEYNNAAVGDEVPYVITSSVPDMTGYEKYYFVVNDTLSKGLTFNNDVHITIAGSAVKDEVDSMAVGDILLTEDDYTVTATKNDTTGTTAIEIVLKDFINYRSNVGDTIFITYSATINEGAVVGATGNTNEVKLTYSNNPNKTGNGDPENPDKPGKDSPVGETPEKVTRTFVTGIELTKVNPSGKPLTGAQFQITGEKLNKVLVSEAKFVSDSNGEYWKLTDGTYTKTAPADDTQESYDGDQKYKREVTDTVKEVKEKVEAIGTVDEAGTLRFNGLSAGTYTITELKAPNGYNLLKDPIEVTISFKAPSDATGDCTWTATITEANAGLVSPASVTNGIITFDVQNQTGTLLPSTGGIGTTIFYVVGGILVVAAGILLVTKKRMSAR